MNSRNIDGKKNIEKVIGICQHSFESHETEKECYDSVKTIMHVALWILSINRMFCHKQMSSFELTERETCGIIR